MCLFIQCSRFSEAEFRMIYGKSVFNALFRALLVDLCAVKCRINSSVTSIRLGNANNNPRETHNQIQFHAK